MLWCSRIPEESDTPLSVPLYLTQIELPLVSLKTDIPTLPPVGKGEGLNKSSLNEAFFLLIFLWTLTAGRELKPGFQFSPFCFFFRAGSFKTGIGI